MFLLSIDISKKKNFFHHDGWEVFVVLGGCPLNSKLLLLQRGKKDGT
jgi:hypothetical protein